MDYKTIMAAAEARKKDLFSFLREIIAIRSFDGEEGAVIDRIEEEFKKLRFDRIERDPMGNLLGYIGSGKRLLAFDGHVDTVGWGDKSNWRFDPLEGFEDEELIGGLGSTDQKGGLAAAIYAARIIGDLDLGRDYTLLVCCSVQEEDCDGINWQYILEQDHIRPEFVILTEPTDGAIMRGQRGRMEIKITVPGKSAHGSMPHLGINAVYKAAPIVAAIERLNASLPDDGVLGTGNVTISGISSTAPSRCAVADSCTLSLDRRLNSKETPDFALEQLRALPEVRAASARVELYSWNDPSYTGLVYPMEKFYPVWFLEKESPLCRSVIEAHRLILGKEAKTQFFVASTNGAAIMGRHNIPCLAYGPGHSVMAHSPNEVTWKKELVESCAIYAAVPLIYTNLD
jgi:putative selenium metabolism hydrolase